MGFPLQTHCVQFSGSSYQQGFFLEKEFALFANCCPNKQTNKQLQDSHFILASAWGSCLGQYDWSAPSSERFFSLSAWLADAFNLAENRLLSSGLKMKN